LRAGTRFREPYAISGGSPAVTVVVAANNQPSLLVTRAVHSVCRQTYDDWELVIVDDASTEDTGAAVAPWLSDPRIRLVRRPVNRGPSAARNTGIRQARGRFICFLDHDDEYLDNKLAHQVKQLESAPDDVAGFVGAWYYAKRPVDGQLRGEVTELRRESSWTSMPGSYRSAPYCFVGTPSSSSALTSPCQRSTTVISTFAYWDVIDAP
jgi:glycosyltransferase involved in cell wall biosynthesis